MLRMLFPLPTLHTALLHTLKVKLKGPHLTGPYLLTKPRKRRCAHLAQSSVKWAFKTALNYLERKEVE